MPVRIRPLRLFLVASMLASLAACASGGKPVAKADEPAVLIVDIQAPMPVADKDALGNYRFEMQQGETRMTADQFDAWMKANGIRVAKGSAAEAAPE